MRMIRVVCVGKVKESYFRDGIKDSLGRIGKRFPVEIRECDDEATPDQASKAQELCIKEKEGQRILSCIGRNDYVVALCIDGKGYSSAAWDRHMDQLCSRVQETLVFVIGGSLGLSDSVIKRADEKLSFSEMTFPHQMMRMILLDQIAVWASRRS